MYSLELSNIHALLDTDTSDNFIYEGLAKNLRRRIRELTEPCNNSHSQRREHPSHTLRCCMHIVHKFTVGLQAVPTDLPVMLGVHTAPVSTQIFCGESTRCPSTCGALISNSQGLQVSPHKPIQPVCMDATRNEVPRLLNAINALRAAKTDVVHVHELSTHLTENCAIPQGTIHYLMLFCFN